MLWVAVELRGSEWQGWKIGQCGSEAAGERDHAGYRAHSHTILVIMQPSGSRHGVRRAQVSP
jgi:hypothetical protein